MKKVFLACLALSLIIVSCSKLDVVEPKSQKKNATHFDLTQSGSIHNDIVNLIYGNNFSLSQQYTITKNYFASQGATFDISEVEYLNSVNQIQSLGYNIDNYKNAGFMSIPVYNHIDQFINDVKLNVNNLNDFLQEVQNLETRYQGDQGLSQKNMNTLIVFSSVIGSSAQLWNSKGGDFGQIEVLNTTSGKPPWSGWKWVRVA